MRDMNLIRSLAWSFHRTTGLSFDDLFGEAVYAFLFAKKKYDPKKGCKFSTFVYPIIKHCLLNFCNKEKQGCLNVDARSYFSRIRPMHEITHPDETFAKITKTLSYTPEYEFFPPVYPDDVKLIIDIIMDSPKEFANVMPKMARGQVFRKLREQGYSHGKCWEMIKNMKKFINETEEFSIII